MKVFILVFVLAVITLIDASDEELKPYKVRLETISNERKPRHVRIYLAPNHIKNAEPFYSSAVHAGGNQNIRHHKHRMKYGMFRIHTRPCSHGMKRDRLGVCRHVY